MPEHTFANAAIECVWLFLFHVVCTFAMHPLSTHWLHMTTETIVHCHFGSSEWRENKSKSHIVQPCATHVGQSQHWARALNTSHGARGKSEFDSCVYQTIPCDLFRCVSKVVTNNYHCCHQYLVTVFPFPIIAHWALLCPASIIHLSSFSRFIGSTPVISRTRPE